MKRSIVALVVVLMALPATATAAPDLRGSEDVPSSSLGIPPNLGQRPSHADVPQYLPAGGTDVAASDQQASERAPAVLTESGSSGDFDWADAGLGAATAASLIGISLAGGIAVRRHRRPTALAG